MRIVLIIVIALVALIGIVALIGVSLPRSHRASSGITLRKPPREVWTVIRDLGALQGTWKELKAARRLPDQGGKEVWEQNAGGWPLRLIIDQEAPPTRLVTRIDAAPDATFGGTWTYHLEPAEKPGERGGAGESGERGGHGGGGSGGDSGGGGGTRVTITEEGYVSNPIFRVMMAVMGTHRTLDGFLRALGTKLGETVNPEHVR